MVRANEKEVLSCLKGVIIINHDLLYFKMQLLQAEIEMNAMIAHNKQCAYSGSEPYSHQEFMSLIEKYGIHHNAFPFYKGE